MRIRQGVVTMGHKVIYVNLRLNKTFPENINAMWKNGVQFSK